MQVCTPSPCSVRLQRSNDALLGPSGGAEAREMPYTELLRDAVQGAPALLEIDPWLTTRLLGSSRSEGSLLGTSNPGRKDTAVIRAFREKLQQVRVVTALQQTAFQEVLHLWMHRRRRAPSCTDARNAVVLSRSRGVGGGVSVG